VIRFIVESDLCCDYLCTRRP